jgi:flagellar biosynthetic protein FliR
MLEALLLERAAIIALAVCRIGGFVVVSPFPGSSVPSHARVGLVLALALPLALTLGAAGPLPAFGLGLVLPASVELAIGLLMGATFRVVLSASEVLAGAVSQASSLSTPMSLDPINGGHSTALSQIATLLAMLVALAAGVHRVVIGYVLGSFRVLPVGSDVDLTAGLPRLISLGGDVLEVGVRLALPVIAVTLAVQAALALISRVAPSLQIFNIGFAVLIASGLMTFAASLGAVSDGLIGFNQLLPELLDGLLGSLRGT